jgi:hypothetical protein
VGLPDGDEESKEKDGESNVSTVCRNIDVSVSSWAVAVDWKS